MPIRSTAARPGRAARSQPLESGASAPCCWPPAPAPRPGTCRSPAALTGLLAAVGQPQAPTVDPGQNSPPAPPIAPRVGALLRADDFSNPAQGLFRDAQTGTGQVTLSDGRGANYNYRWQYGYQDRSLVLKLPGPYPDPANQAILGVGAVAADRLNADFAVEVVASVTKSPNVALYGLRYILAPGDSYFFRIGRDGASFELWSEQGPTSLGGGRTTSSSAVNPTPCGWRSPATRSAPSPTASSWPAPSSPGLTRRGGQLALLAEMAGPPIRRRSRGPLLRPQAVHARAVGSLRQGVVMATGAPVRVLRAAGSEASWRRYSRRTWAPASLVILAEPHGGHGNQKVIAGQDDISASRRVVARHLGGLLLCAVLLGRLCRQSRGHARRRCRSCPPPSRRPWRPSPLATAEPTSSPAPPRYSPMPSTPTVAPQPRLVIVLPVQVTRAYRYARPPGTGDRLKVLKDGAELTVLGAAQQVAGHSWAHVKDQDGIEGWVAAEFTTPARANAAAAIAALTTATGAPLTPTVAIIATPTIPPTPKPGGRATPQGSDCPVQMPIKGNQSGLYHVPGGAFYAATKPEACFATTRRR